MTAKRTKRRADSPKPARKVVAARPANSANKSKTKLDAMIAALSAPKGATLAQLTGLTGWQVHSVRGAMSGALKKQRGLAIVSVKTGKERVYRIESGK
jgi:hypothetical protein